MSKIEDKMRNLLDDYMVNNVKKINERVGGVFLYGFMTGVIASYSGFISYIAGISTGIIIAKKYDYISYYISENCVELFQYINNLMYNNNINNNNNNNNNINNNNNKK